MTGYLDHPRPVAMAHRGGALTPGVVGLENSARAFASAVEAGYRFLETDVHVSRDGVVFAFHDDRLDRVTDRRGLLADLDAADVHAARIGGREPVPTLRELLERFPDACFNIDVKADGAVDAVVDLVRRSGCSDRVCLAAFSSRRVRRLRAALGPGVVTSAGSGEVALLRLLPWSWVTRRVLRRGARCVQVPYRRGRITVATAGFVRRMHAHGVPVHVWTIDDPDEMGTLLDRGVDGIITDRTDVLKDVLVRRDAWTGAG